MQYAGFARGLDARDDKDFSNHEVLVVLLHRTRESEKHSSVMMVWTEIPIWYGEHARTRTQNDK